MVLIVSHQVSEMMLKLSFDFEAETVRATSLLVHTHHHPSNGPLFSPQYHPKSITQLLSTMNPKPTDLLQQKFSRFAPISSTNTQVKSLIPTTQSLHKLALHGLPTPFIRGHSPPLPPFHRQPLHRLLHHGHRRVKVTDCPAPQSLQRCNYRAS